MKRYTLSLLLFLATALSMTAQKVSLKWELSNKDNLSASTITGNSNNILSATFSKWSGIDSVATMKSGGAETGYTAPTYTPYFTQFYVTTRNTSRTKGQSITFTVKTPTGHTFKPTRLSLDAAKCGTDGGNFDVCTKLGSNAEQPFATTQVPLRNKAAAGNPNGYSHHEYTLSDVLAEGCDFQVTLYIYNINGTDNANPKAIAFRNVVIEGVVDEPIYTAEHYITDATFTTKAGETMSMMQLVKNLKNGQQVSYPELLFGDPSNFRLTTAAGYNYNATYANKTATFNILNSDGETEFSFSVLFRVTNREPKPKAAPLKRGLMAINLAASGGSGNLVSWRYRKNDNNQVRFKLYRGTSATTQNTKLNSGNYIHARTNFRDTGGTTSSYYKLEVYDLNDNLLETEVSGKAWDNQMLAVPVGKAPVDTRNGDQYLPNDAAICDMDGDGEYEIILKWYPQKSAKDAASSGTTSNIIFDCYKLDGTRLWRIDMGPNFFASAHTIQFIAWDLDGDGYGEFMVKTAPGTIDGEGNYVIMGNDDPTANWLNSRGKQVEGPEYITVFDGTTGAELSTIPYHTNYAAGASVWGDSEQNRSERYLAAIAWLDGPDKNPSPIFARGYYKGAFVAAYDWDGSMLKERWVSRNTTSGKGLWGEGAHWISVGDCDEDGKQEIIYGSGALDHDGSLLYRTGLGHGDALHLADFLPEREGMEVFMVHEEKPYGYDLRDAKTGEFILHKTASSDTGRGLAAHFDSSSEHSQFIYSASSAMLDCMTGNEIASTWAIGSSGAGINNRIFWDGDPYEEFFDKSIIAHWNPTNKCFDRYKFNNGNYTWGELNNASKNNPCLLADILGDWREEIVTWSNTDMDYDKSSGLYTVRGDFYLIIGATNHESELRIPHLMDDLNYRAQVINQNCCYNQPPHLSYDPAYSNALTVTIPESGWMSLYTPYALQAPASSEAKAYYVTNVNAAVDTLRMTAITTTIPACGFLLQGKPGTTITMRPAGVTATANASNKLLGDGYLPAEVKTSETVSFYRWENRPGIGLGFFRVDEGSIQPGEAYLRLTTASTRDAERYLIGSTVVGDVNKDGTVSIADVTALVNIVLASAEPNDKADVNGDGEVSIADVTALVNIILGRVK